MIRKAAHAKVNLHLEVLRRRPDGYHDILTLMQRISLHDEMTFAPAEAGIHLRCPGSALPEDDGNLVVRAARAFFRAYPVSAGIRITLDKRIPVAAGLGGGSSDAAATLIAMNELFGMPIAQAELLPMGASLGADVPFFLYGHAAWASGIGDRLERAEGIPPVHLVLITPPFGVSTSSVYERLNLNLTNEPVQYKVPRFSGVEGLAGILRNDLERVTTRLHPVLCRIKERLLAEGARGSLMSGSGPTVFGIFDRADRAAAAADSLRTSVQGTILVSETIH